MCYSKDKYRFAIVCMLPYPEGEASTVRIHSYCKALADEGYFVKVYILTPLTNNNNTQINGIFEKVHYEYLYGIKWNTSSYIIKFATYLRSLFKIQTKLLSDKINCILTYHDELIFNSSIKFFSKKHHIKLLIDKTEYPFHFFDKKRLFQKLAIWQLHFYDGIITISHELSNFYFSFKNNVFLLPMSVNPNIYDNIKIERQNTEQYIAVVFGTHNRDNIKDSVSAYIEYLKRCVSQKPLKLYLIGNFNALIKRFPENTNILKLIDSSEYKDNIKILGSLTNKEVLKILSSASCLLTTPLKYNSGGFPTKLGEYLLSGNPVIATTAGEIPLYLTHKVNAYLCKPGDIQSISDAMLYITKNPISAKEIGLNGKKLALAKFNATNYIPNLIKFINTVQQ